jgi:hypothetical protein
MDTNMIKPVGLIVAGGVVGGVIGYFLGGLIVDQLRKRAKEDEEAERSLSSEEPKHGVVTVREVTKQDYTKFAKGELSELVKPYTSSIDEESKKANAKPEKIMIISLDAFESDRGFNKEPIAYYEDDTTFANTQEEIIDDPVSIFGPNVHLHFGEESDDPDIVYVRNENNGVDYEITRVHNSYSIVVMGMPPEPPKETKAKRRRNVRKVTAHDDEDNEDESED